MTNNKKFLKIFSEVILVLLLSVLSAFCLHVFVYPSNFAPSGVEGIATMIQHKTEFNAGIISLLFNIPLLIAAWFVLKKKYVIYTLVFNVLSSALILLLDKVEFYQYTDNAADGLVAAIFSGIILGIRTGLMLKLGASTGGADIPAGIINHKMPHFNTERIISIICYATILFSFFVYDKNITSVLLSFVQMFLFDKFASAMMKDRRNAIEVKIITKEPEKMKHDIIYNLKHGATVLDGRGMYTDGKSSVIISVINIRQIPEFYEIMKNHPEAFAYFGELGGVKGNFRWRRDDAVK